MNPIQASTASFRTPTEQEVREKPWRYIGYKLFSEWSASADEFFVIRLFGNLATRVILRMQWEISELEKELGRIDDHWMFRSQKDVNNGAFRRDSEERKEVLDRIVERLKQYCKSDLSTMFAAWIVIDQFPAMNPDSLPTSI